MNLEIRDGRISDYAGISKLVAEVHQLHLKNRPDVYKNIDNPFNENQFEEILNGDDTKLFVVEDIDSKELLAYSIVQSMTPKNILLLIPVKFVYVDDFCVKAKHQNKGIGKLLFKHIVAYGKAEGALSIQLTVWEFNENAIKFYEAIGFKTRNRRLELKL